MRITSRQTGDVIDWNDEGARELIDAGIYDAADPKAPPKEPPPKKGDKPTKVEPLSTDDMPPPVKTPKKGL